MKRRLSSKSVRRAGRAVGSPLAVLLIACLLRFGVAAGSPLAAELGPSSGLRVARLAAAATIVAGLGWLALRIHRVVYLQPRRDQEAAQTLEVMRLEASAPRSALIEIHTVQWAVQSGQRVWAVDVLTGAVSDRWLPGPARPVGTLVLLRQSSKVPATVVAFMTPGALAAANRHSREVGDRTASPGTAVVEAAERLLRDRH